MSIYEYDEEKHLRMEREENYEKGYKLGEQQKLIDLVKKKLARGIPIEEIATALEEKPETIQKIVEELKN